MKYTIKLERVFDCIVDIDAECEEDAIAEAMSSSCQKIDGWIPDSNDRPRLVQLVCRETDTICEDIGAMLEEMKRNGACGKEIDALAEIMSESRKRLSKYQSYSDPGTNANTHRI